MHDLITFGEAMVRLSPSGFARLEQATQLAVQIGGSEYNVALGAARLGLRTGWVTRLPDNPLGRMVRNKAREQGVDTSAIAWAKDARVGLYFVEFGAAPRPSAVLYDRANSACATIQPDEIDWDGVLQNTRAFHVSGITAALSPSAMLTVRKAMEAAHRARCLISYDLNYRKNLWSPEEARKFQEPLMPLVDLLITTEEDAHVVFGIRPSQPDADHHYASLSEHSYESVARRLQERFGCQAVAITLRENPLVWKNSWSAILLSGGEVFTAPKYELEVVDRIGAGDSFAAGLIYSYLTHSDWQRAVSFAVAFSALKHTIPGDVNWATPAETESLLKGASLRVAR